MFSSFVGNISLKDCKVNLFVKFLESKASLIKLRFSVKASLNVPLFSYLVMNVGLQNFFMPMTSQALFIAMSPFDWGILNPIKNCVGA